MADSDSTKKHKRSITTARQLDLLKPDNKEYEVSDAGCPGLRIRVATTGRKTFRWYYQTSTKKRAVKTLGTYSKSFGLQDARSKLGQAKAAHKQALVTGEPEGRILTVSDLADVFYQRRIEKQRKHPQDALRIIETDIKPKIGRYKIDEIQPFTIGNMVMSVVDRGAVAHAGKVLSVTKQMFNFAVSLGHIQYNPALPLKAENLGVQENMRDRYLTAEEINKFWTTLGSMPRMSEQMKIAFKLLLLTGVRTGELLKAQWENVDLRKREWIIPVADQKLTIKQAQKGKPFIIPLSGLAVSLFKELKEYAHGNPNVMASPTAESGRYDDKSLGHALRRMLKQKVDDAPMLSVAYFTPHDLRRTLRTHLSETLNVQPHIAEKCLNHSLGRIEQVYNQSELLSQRREALERWSDFIDRSITDDRKVVEIRA